MFSSLPGVFMETLKAFAKFAIFLVLCWGLLEICSWIAFKPITGTEWDRDQQTRARADRFKIVSRLLEESESQEKSGLYYLHPYLGYNGRPGAKTWGNAKGTDMEGIAYNKYGFMPIPERRYPYKKKNNEFVIAVVGGSVADIFTIFGPVHLERELRQRDPKFKDKKLVVLTLATAGFKQPQQLFAILYSLLLDFDIDLILNIDGFNDMVLSVENFKHGIHPMYPSGFHMGLLSKRVGGVDRKTVNLIYRFYELLEREKSIHLFIKKAYFRWSLFLNLFAEIQLKNLQGQIEKIQYKMAEKAQNTIIEDFKGPAIDPDSNPLKTALEIWKRSTELLYSIAREQEIPYIHVIQPNQYFEGSKPLSEQEKKVAFDPGLEWSQVARKSYPVLVKMAEQMNSKGFPIADLTQIFKEVREDVYTDVCCHFGLTGNAILAHHIAPIILNELKVQGP